MDESAVTGTTLGFEIPTTALAGEPTVGWQRPHPLFCRDPCSFLYLSLPKEGGDLFPGGTIVAFC
jgi:hypothetical protein